MKFFESNSWIIQVESRNQKWKWIKNWNNWKSWSTWSWIKRCRFVFVFEFGGFWLWNCARDLGRRSGNAWNLLQCFCHDDSACLSCHNFGPWTRYDVGPTRCGWAVFDTVGQNFLCALQNDAKRRRSITDESIGFANIFKGFNIF